MPTGEVYIILVYSTIVINTTEKIASTTELRSPVIRDITVTLVSEQSTELSKGPKVVSSRFQIVEYCLTNTELPQELKLCLHLRLYPLVLKFWNTVFHEFN